jgi:hypothetical protein
MRHLLRLGTVGMLSAMLATGCVTSPPAGVQAPGVVEVLPADARALRYGSSAPAVFDSAELRDKVRALFGSDWTPAAQGGGRLQYGAAAYFPANSSIRMLRVDALDYIAITGCVSRACATHRGLVLIRADGVELWGRLDEGGFSRYYGHGPAMTGAQVSPAFIDSAWRALEGVERNAARPKVEWSS